MTLVTSGTGVMALVTEYAGERSTRFGETGPLHGAIAQRFGLTVFVLGLLPLLFFARSPRSAVWFAGSVMGITVLTVFLGGIVLH